jgi:transposase-like protein
VARTTTYTPAEKAAAIKQLTEFGLAETWRRTGISKPTLSLWGKRAGLTFDTSKTEAATAQHEARQAELRVQLRVMLLEKAVDLLERMDAPHVEFKGKDADRVEYPIAPAGAVQNYATSAAILIDKYRLEMGEVTGRTETQSVTGGLNDDERARLRDAIDRYYGRRAGGGDDGSGAHGDPAGVGAEVRE